MRLRTTTKKQEKQNKKQKNRKQKTKKASNMDAYIFAIFSLASNTCSLNKVIHTIQYIRLYKFTDTINIPYFYIVVILEQ